MIGPGSLVCNKSIVTIWFYIPTSSTPWLKCLELRLFWTRSVNFCLFWIRVSWSRSRVLIAEFTKTPVITLSTCTTIYLCIWYIHLPVHLSESTPRFICPCFHWHTFISSSPCYLLSCTQKSRAFSAFFLVDPTGEMDKADKALQSRRKRYKGWKAAPISPPPERDDPKRC